jgi:hypothetical protein
VVLCTNSSLNVDHVFPIAGTYRITARVQADPNTAGPPILAIRVGGVALGQVEVPGTTFLDITTEAAQAAWEPFLAPLRARPEDFTVDVKFSSQPFRNRWNPTTREAIFDAMKRRETYATTGSRMAVRFFGGWEFEPKDVQNRMPAALGYGKGVPMGGDLNAAPAGKSPTFLVAALKDPIGANLDRIQIVKGWVDAKGAVQEKVYDVAWGDAEKRKPGADGKLPPVGSTVDVANASWTNTIGDPELITVWKDPSFDRKQRPFYYARVLEIPTPRWTAYDAKRFGIQPLPGTTLTLQERAYTSPIWYTP